MVTVKSKKKSSATIITICSSVSFYKQVIEVRDTLKKMGFRVLVPLTAGKMERTGDFRVETYKTWFSDPRNYKRKTFLTKHHFNKVARGHAVLVANYEKKGIPGYIGGAVLNEMAIGFYLGKPIYILNSVENNVNYLEEILAMQPTIVHGDLGKIK